MGKTLAHPMTHIARRMFELLEPICLVTFFADECNEELAALGHRTYWDGYFASRAAPLGRVPASVVHAAFYSFADGEAARDTGDSARAGLPGRSAWAPSHLRGGRRRPSRSLTPPDRVPEEPPP
jgi:hypothetical protein